MIIRNIQEKIEKSLYESIRLILVQWEYLPDIAQFGLSPWLPNSDHIATQAQWDEAISTIRNTFGFAIEVFGHGSSQAKGLKKVPRIVISPKRLVPGDIGTLVGNTIVNHPTNGGFVYSSIPQQSMHFQIDIHLVANTAQQDRVLHSVIAAAFGPMKYLRLYDNSGNFFIRQYAYYDLPNQAEGIEEKVYSYEVTDIYITEIIGETEIAPIVRIDVEEIMNEKTIETITVQIPETPL